MIMIMIIIIIIIIICLILEKSKMKDIHETTSGRICKYERKHSPNIPHISVSI